MQLVKITKMFHNGLLILTQPVTKLKLQIPQLLDHISTLISDTVYIHLQPSLCSTQALRNSLLTPVPYSTEVQSLIYDVYTASPSCQSLDIRILLSHVTNGAQGFSPSYSLEKSPDVVVSDAPFLMQSWNSDRDNMVDVMRKTFTQGIHEGISFHLWSWSPPHVQSTEKPEHSPATQLKTYENVVLGGTFDRLHNGHKLLLSQSCLLCEKTLVVGITDEAMNQRKVLKELILPWEKRRDDTVAFVTDVKPGINVEPVCITDVYGPTATRADLQCLVVSQETVKGAQLINSEREKAKLPLMDIVTMDLVEDKCHAPEEEEKVSSSSQRRRLLGTLLKPPLSKAYLPATPYRIGLTGGIASGKSNMCKELEKLGAAIINCDLLGHKAYEPGTEGFRAVLSEFGQDLLTDNGEIDRKKLGTIVFADKSRLEKLNSLIWPEIMKLAEKQIEQITAGGHTKVVVLEAAVLLEAGWDQSVHEVWTTFVPREEAIKRMRERNLTEDQAIQRLDSQMSNKDRIARSNVVVCPLWEFEYTRKQIQRAWSSLQRRIQPTASL